MEERFDKQTQERAVLVGLNADCFAEEDTATESTLDELEDLLETAGGFCTGKVLQNRHTPDSHSFIGEGKAQEVRMLAEATQSTMVIFDNELSPGNIRALEEIIGLPVLDRSALILDIFAQRAKTKEGRLQVELAQYKYLLPRLSGMGTSLSRQGGGIGIRQLPCGGKAGLEVCAGGIKVLLGGNAANHGAVYFHLQGKVQVQPMGNHSPKYHPGGAGGKPWHQLPQRVRPGQRGAECLPQLQHRGKQQPDKIKRSIPRSVRRGGSLAAQADEPIFC